MKPKKGRKGGAGLSNLVISIIWALVAIGGILAAVQALGATSADSAFEVAKEKAAHYVECIPAGECGIASIIKNWGTGSGPNLEVSPGGSSNPSDPSEPSNPSEPVGTEDGSGLPSQPAIEGLEPVTRETKGYRGPSHGEPFVNNTGFVVKEFATDLLNKLNISESEEVEYNRSEWKHWSNTKGKPCWNTREEILNRDAEQGTVVYVDKKMNSTVNYDEACAIGKPVKDEDKVRINTEKSGQWVDPYSGRTITSSSDLDIDHIIPLNYAAQNGGQSWSADKKEEFANDPDNLLATSAKENRSKGSKGPSGYMPPYKGYRCQYAKSFVGVANKYGLSITKKDSQVLNKVLEGCQI